jgi:hypothetical protein
MDHRRRCCDRDIDAAMSTNEKTTPYCSFCGKSQHGVEILIARPNDIYICNECVELTRLRQILIDLRKTGSTPARMTQNYGSSHFFGARPTSKLLPRLLMDTVRGNNVIGDVGNTFAHD